jgi:superfamily I DNA/RNA helicase
MRAAYSLIETDPLLNLSEDIIPPDLDSSELIEGEKPQLITFRQPDQEITFIEEAIDMLVESGVQPRSIAIFCHSRRSLKNWDGLQKRHKQLFVAHFERMKGLDFDIVFLPHLNFTFKAITDSGAISEMRRRVYVGMTRARDRLVLSCCDTLPEALTPLESFIQT